MCWPFRQKKITGILTQDVFTHSLSFDADNFTIYLEGQDYTLPRYYVNEIRNHFNTTFAVLVTIELKKDKVVGMKLKNIFKVSDSNEQSFVTVFSFFYKVGEDLFIRHITKFSKDLIGFQSSAVNKPWFYIDNGDDFVIVPENTKMFYDVGYFSQIDFSFPKLKVEKPEIENENDYSFRVDDEDGIGGLGF